MKRHQKSSGANERHQEMQVAVQDSHVDHRTVDEAKERDRQAICNTHQFYILIQTR